MSRLGRVSFQERAGSAFLHGAPGDPAAREYSERTAREIDQEVRKILDESTDAVREVLRARRGALEALAQRLIEREVIDGAELRQLLEEHTPGLRLVPGSEAVVSVTRVATEKPPVDPTPADHVTDHRALGPM